MQINSKLLATIATIVGIVAGSFGMWFTLKDRMEAQIEARVRKDIQTETRLTKIEERLETIKTDLWAIKMSGSGNDSK